MERLKSIKETLIAQIQGQMGNLDCVDAEELGEVVDMVKDIEEAIYYCTITKAMEEKDEKRDTINYYMTNYPSEPYYYRDIDRNDGRMYYTPGANGGGRSNSGNNNSDTNYSNRTNYYQDQPRDSQGRTDTHPSEIMRDSREGQSPRARKMYMESKETHQDSKKQMESLEKYMHELTDDVMEMVKEATPEEKQILKNKMNLLAQKIV